MNRSAHRWARITIVSEPLMVSVPVAAPGVPVPVAGVFSVLLPWPPLQPAPTSATTSPMRESTVLIAPPSSPEGAPRLRQSGDKRATTARRSPPPGKSAFLEIDRQARPQLLAVVADLEVVLAREHDADVLDREQVEGEDQPGHRVVGRIGVRIELLGAHADAEVVAEALGR